MDIDWALTGAFLAGVLASFIAGLLVLWIERRGKRRDEEEDR